MSTIMKYRGRLICAEDIVQIQQLIAENPTTCRFQLSKRLCELWNWRQQNGCLRDMVCRGMMLALHRGGHIVLPVAKKGGGNSTRRRQPARVEIDSAPIALPLRELSALQIRLVRQTADESLFNSLLETHHYLGYSQPVGEHLKYMIYWGERPLACMAWCSAVRHLSGRDTHIGWTQQDRQRNLHLIAYNTRYLIMPWVRVPHLASHLLGVMARRISADWQELYHHPVYFLETFIDPHLYKGTCYRAANWVSLGLTTGRGKNDTTHKPTRSRKEVLGYPLHRHFREILRAGGT